MEFHAISLRSGYMLAEEGRDDALYDCCAFSMELMISLCLQSKTAANLVRLDVECTYVIRGWLCYGMFCRFSVPLWRAAGCHMHDFHNSSGQEEDYEHNKTYSL